MKITFAVAAIDNSGGFRVIVALANQLAMRGHEVCILAPVPPRRSLGALVRGALGGKWQWRSGASSDYLADFAGEVRIVDHVAPLGPADFPNADCVIATWWETMRWVAALPDSKGHKVHLIQDYEIWPPNSPKAVDRVLAMPGQKIAVSKYLADILQDKFGHDNVLFLENAVDGDQFFAGLRTKNSDFTVGFVYSSALRKGSDLVINALCRAREQVPGLKALAFGHGDVHPAVPVPGWIEYHPRPDQRELRQLYSACDAWLFGSRAEGYGLPILEAMACGTPVIGMPAGAAPDLLGNGCGILVPDRDWRAMADAIVALAQGSANDWARLSARASARVERNTWALAGQKLEDVLSGLVARHPGPSMRA